MIIWQKASLLALYLLLASCASSMLPSTAKADTYPMDYVMTLLDTKGGNRLGKTADNGYFIVSVAFARNSNPEKAYARARKQAVDDLEALISGNKMEASVMRAVDDKVVGFNPESFYKVVDSQFINQFDRVKLLKKGQYGGKYFVAMLLAEKASEHKNASAIQSTANDASAAHLAQDITTVEARGIASLSAGTQQARELAIEDALKNAVQQAQGVVLSSHSGSFNGAISTVMSTKTKGYVKNYELLDEETVRGEYRVLIVAEVDSATMVKDVSFYLDAFGSPRFTVESNDRYASSWLRPQLEKLGFHLSENRHSATHSFRFRKEQFPVTDHLNQKGYKTRVSLTLVDAHNGDILFTIANDEHKTGFYVAPLERAAQVSEKAAFKQLEEKLPLEVVEAIARSVE